MAGTSGSCGTPWYHKLVFSSPGFPSDPTRNIVVIWVKIFQTELKVEICSKSLVRAIDEVLLIKFS